MENRDNQGFEALIRSLSGESMDSIIPDQEKRGQSNYVKDGTKLPRDFNGCNQDDFEKMGIVFVEIADDLFWRVNLPSGWGIVRTDHSMWSNLVDNKGRTRANIFYKAAFYDTRANINTVHRYTAVVEPACGYESPDFDWATTPRVGVVRDGDKEIWRTDEYDHDNDDAARHIAREWLDINYPDWQNVHAYWD